MLNLFKRKSKRLDYQWTHCYVNSLGDLVNCIISSERRRDGLTLVINEYGSTVALSPDDVLKTTRDDRATD